MPVPGFLASFADKAQNAINTSPLASLTQPSPDGSSGHKHTLESFSNQLRVISQQYSTTSPIQKVITTEKSVALDSETLSRDAKYQSKELFTWGKNESEDLKDVTDRLAYVNFIHGSLAGSLAQKLEAARGPLKALRNAENAIVPRRAMRANLHNQIVRMQHEQPKGSERKLAELKELLRKTELEDQPHENEFEILKRKAVRESEAAKWQALREYGEKLVLVSQTADLVIAALPSIPPSSTIPYAGAQATAAARAALQKALDNYQTGHVGLPTHSAVDLNRADTRSFGESHANELSRIEVPPPVVSNTSAPSTDPAQPQQPVQPTSDKPISSIDTTTLNQSPSPVPAISLPSTAIVNLPSSTVLPAVTPTVAETGIPVSAGPDGPGPASGSLLDLKSTAPDATRKDEDNSTSVTGAVQTFPSAKEEKKKLKETSSQEGASLAAGTDVAAPEHHESVEEEKKRLEREERERILAAASVKNNDDNNDNIDEELPPYKEL